MSVDAFRQQCALQSLNETEVAPDPFVQFRRWFDQALAAQLPEPHAMTLATVTADGKPAARVVLLRSFDDSGFVFYTNYDSRKGQELAANPWAALVFFWVELHRQIRIEGRVQPVTPEESDAYFRSRPWGNCLSAWASRQSQVIGNREVLEQRMQELMAEYQNRVVPRPPYWGGYRVLPTAIEFWQGRPNRLHDRLHYVQLEDGSWRIQRLSP